MDIEDLIRRISLAKKNDGYFCFLDDEGYNVVKTKIMDWYAEQKTELQLAEEITILKAKCFAYEQIIAKSNFAPFVKEKSKKGNDNEQNNK